MSIYNLKVEGKYRHRLRINIFGWWIQGPWITDSFSQSIPVNVQDQTVHFAFPKIPVSLDAKLSNFVVDIDLMVIGQSIVHEEFKVIGTNNTVPFSLNPWKGVSLSGTARLVLAPEIAKSIG